MSKKSQKDNYRFSLGFSKEDKDQKLVSYVLENIGHGKKADFITKAILSYISNNPTESIVEIASSNKELASLLMEKVLLDKIGLTPTRTSSIDIDELSSVGKNPKIKKEKSKSVVKEKTVPIKKTTTSKPIDKAVKPIVNIAQPPQIQEEVEEFDFDDDELDAMAAFLEMTE